MTLPRSEPPQPETIPSSAPPGEDNSRTHGVAPYVPEKKPQTFSLRDNARVLVMGAGVALILILVAVNGVPHKSRAGAKTLLPGEQPRSESVSDPSAAGATSLTPILEIGASPREDGGTILVDAERIDRTASSKPRPIPVPPVKLASVPPFSDPSWQPTPYPGDRRNLAGSEAEVSKRDDHKVESHAIDRDSLVFVNKATTLPPRREQEPPVPFQEQIGLPAGSRLRAKLESAINSAVQAPVVAVIEYNYERNGEMVVPAGAKATGKLVTADRSGTLEIRFDTLQFPYAAAAAFHGIATDLELRPLRGRVQGRRTAKNFLVRSAAGVGEIAATLIGRGTLNRPLSEDDLFRERLSTNIGQAADQQISNAALSSRLVVTLAAGTEIYIVLEKEVVDHPQTPPPQVSSPRQSLDELRQLLDLQRELNAPQALSH